MKTAKSPAVVLVLLPILVLFTAAVSTAQTSDTEPPVLTDFSFSPASVNVTDGAKIVTFTVRATDNLSGLSVFYAYISSPSGTQERVAGGVWSSPSPPVLEGNATGVVQIPKYAEPGQWKIMYLRLYDNVSNMAYYSGAMLETMGYSTEITVEDDTPDLTPPELTSISMTPSAVDVSEGPAAVQVELGISDAVSGYSQAASGFDFYLSSPTGIRNIILSRNQFVLISGDAHSGTYSATLQVPQYAEAGTWKITSITLRDEASNGKTYLPADLSSFGTNINLEVSSDMQDLSAPAISAIRFIPSFIDTSIGPQTVQVELDMTDNLAGVRFAPTTPSISLIQGPLVQSPSGLQSAFVNPFGGWSLTSGTTLDGTWSGTFTLQQYSEEGTWAALNSRVEDAALNASVISRQKMEELGLTTTFTVIKPSLETDGTVNTSGGTVQDSVFGSRASVTFPPDILAGITDVAIDVLSSPISVPIPTGFSGADTFFVNIHLDPEPEYPLPPPGLTIVLPLKTMMDPGTAIYLYRINPESGDLEPAMNTSGHPVVGYADSSGDSATFMGIARLSTVVGLQALPIELRIDVMPGSEKNPINTKAQGIIPVVIYGTLTLDASRIDAGSLQLSGAAVSKNKNGKYNATGVDYDGDGFGDLLVHFDVKGLQLAPGSGTAELTGETLDYRQIWGEDGVLIVH